VYDPEPGAWTIEVTAGPAAPFPALVEIAPWTETAASPLPVATAKNTIVQLEPELVVEFDASDSSSPSGISTFLWSFGDGTQAHGPIVSHSYESGKLYRPTLTVVDNDGGIDVFRLDPLGTNAPPIGVDDTYSVPASGLLQVAVPGVLKNDTDPDLGPLTAELVAGPHVGTVDLRSDGSFEYFAAPDRARTFFVYRARDDVGASSVDVTVHLVSELPDVDGDGVPDAHDNCVDIPNDQADSDADGIGDACEPNAPVARDDEARTDEDTPVSIDVLANDSDPDDDLDPTSVRVVVAPSFGSAELEGTSIRYTPDADRNGIDSFVYEVCDATGLCDTATVTIDVRAVNDAPIAIDDSATTTRETPVIIDVLANDTDVESTKPISSSVVSNPTKGTAVSLLDGSIRYTANPGACGVDTFTYTASDGSASSAPATVTVTIDCPESPPSTPPTDGGGDTTPPTGGGGGGGRATPSPLETINPGRVYESRAAVTVDGVAGQYGSAVCWFDDVRCWLVVVVVCRWMRLLRW
jgi:hypothetical protein